MGGKLGPEFGAHNGNILGGAGIWAGNRAQILGRKSCPCLVLGGPGFGSARARPHTQNRALFGKACACWRWWNFLSAQVPAGRIIIRLNLDETAVSLYQSGGKGNVFLERGMAPVQHAPLSVRRKYLTYVAVVCDDPCIQPLLPQVLIANERTVPAARLAALRSSLPPNVYLLRRRSAWNNATLCAQIIRMIGKALAPYAATHQGILYLDCAKIHVGPGIFYAANDSGLWASLVPPQETYLIQPLDAQVFGLFKLCLQKSAQDEQIRSPSGEFDIGGLVSAVCTAIRTILQGREWSSAFVSCGFGHRQSGLSDRVKRALEVTDTPEVGVARPSLGVLRVCFPKRSLIPTRAVRQPCDGPVAAPRAVVAPVAPAPAAFAPVGPRRSVRLLARASSAPPTASGASSSSALCAAAPLATPV